MELTNIDGFELICIKDFNDALHRLKEITELANNLRSVMLHDISILQNTDKNTFAKSIRLITKFTTNIDDLSKVRL